MAKKPEADELAEAKRIMARMVRMPPKPHDQMKVGKKTKKGRPLGPTKRRPRDRAVDV